MKNQNKVPKEYYAIVIVIWIILFFIFSFISIIGFINSMLCGTFCFEFAVTLKKNRKVAFFAGAILGIFAWIYYLIVYIYYKRTKKIK